MGIMLDSIRYRLYAVESETSEPSGTMSRIRLEYRAGNITYGLELREPFGPGIVADEARSFDPGKPMAMPPVWLLVRGDATPERGLRCLTLAVTVLDGVDADGNVHAGVEVSYPCGLPEDALNGARFALWCLWSNKRVRRHHQI